MQGQPQNLVLILTHESVKCGAGTCLRLANQFRLVGAGLHTSLIPARLVLALPACPAHCLRHSHTWERLYPSPSWPSQNSRRVNRGEGKTDRVCFHSNT